MEKCVAVARREIPMDFSLLSGTLKNRKIRRPGTDFRHVASRHHAIDLVQVVQVVHRPRSEKLAQCHDAKGRVRACEIQLRASQPQASQIPEVARAKIRKFTQQINDRLPRAVSELCEAIEGRERDGGSVLENDVHARHPIGLFAVDEVSDAIERTPVLRIILAVNPRLRQVSELVVQDFRRARKNRDAFGKEGLAHMRRISESLPWQQGQLQRTPPPVRTAESSRDVEKLPRPGILRDVASPRYSARKAVIGSTRPARRAGR